MTPTKSGWENYAYTKDASADTHFCIDTSSLKKNTIYKIDFSNMTQVDHQRLIFSLQGLINRDFNPDLDKTTMLFVNKDDSDPDWLKYCREDGATFCDLDIHYIKDLGEFYDIFLHTIKSCGLVLWDSKVPATANLALTVCSLDGYLPVLSGSDLESFLTNRGVEVKLSFVDKFDGSETGSAKNDVYRYGLREYFPRCSSTYLAYILDGACCAPDSIFSKMRHSLHNCLANHDYIIARRCFAFDLFPRSDEAPCDDLNQRLGLDCETMLMIFAERFKRANGAIGQLLGFPPWWIKYTHGATYPDGTIVNEKHPVFVEWSFTEYISCYNLAKEADAFSPCSMSNGSFYYKYRMRTEKFVNNKEKKNIIFDPDVLYFTIYGGDYDSSAWLKLCAHDFIYKNDPARGNIEMMWAFNPNLSYRVPMVFDYIYSHMSKTDRFVGGDSGAGYVMPSGLFDGYTMGHTNFTRPAENGDGRKLWAEYSRKFYDIFDYDITGFIINGNNPYDEEVMELFNQISPGGNMHDCPINLIRIYKGVPYVGCYNEVHDHLVPDMFDFAFAQNPYNFAAYRSIRKSPSQIKEIVDHFTDYSTKNGKKVQYVDVYTFFDLIKQSGQGDHIE